ncbi:hypothetical protein COO91_05067 [Nostoc flagelliforme CCNUN1]|uniref:Uncharacterized protein n=1 Tax=Nostoc flagelliforme CCNUN1 TaxID=2038116 RepID=A0A2K8SUE4_9NOSO|nr:hypothetical protein COO91_05067 [Nostoc flagelliforme CCNUN1]
MLQLSFALDIWCDREQALLLLVGIKFSTLFCSSNPQP